MDHDAGPLPLDLFALGRGLAYAASLALIGACVFAALIPRWREASDDDGSLAARALGRAWSVAAGAAAVLLFAHLLRGLGQVRSALDPGEPITWDVASPILLQTAWGRGWLAQVLVAIATVPATQLGRRRPATGIALLGGTALAVAAVSPLTGHAIEHPWGKSLGVGLHALHLIGGGVWLGTLLALLLAGLKPAATGDVAAVARMVRTFSPVALTGAGLAVVAGTLLGYAYIGNLTSLTGTTYGRALLIKLTLLLCAMGLGAWNWRRITPQLGTPDATRALTRSATAELAFGLALVAVTAVLVALPAPRI